MTDATGGQRRKLTTIFCADVQGYSALVERDEIGTFNRLKQYRAVMTAEIERHHGRVINTWGDGLLAEFSSPVEAVFSAVETQRQIAASNAETPDMPSMQFRIGINLGDVMIEGDDLYGEGVNIASRLQSLAEPGGICISGSVFEQVRKKLDIGFASLGPREIKNIAEPVQAYRVLIDRPAVAANPAPAAPSPEPQVPPGPFEKWRHRAWRFGVILAFLIVINLLTSPGYFWFVWPMLYMGLHLALTFPFGAFPDGILPPRRGGR